MVRTRTTMECTTIILQEYTIVITPTPLPLPKSTDRLAQVETSSNLASVTPIKTDNQGNGTYEILCSTRSSLSPPLEAVRGRIKKAAELCGASNVLRRQAYPGWQPDLQSNVLKVTGGVLARVQRAAPVRCGAGAPQCAAQGGRGGGRASYPHHSRFGTLCGHSLRRARSFPPCLLTGFHPPRVFFCAAWITAFR